MSTTGKPGSDSYGRASGESGILIGNVNGAAATEKKSDSSKNYR